MFMFSPTLTNLKGDSMWHKWMLKMLLQCNSIASQIIWYLSTLALRQSFPCPRVCVDGQGKPEDKYTGEVKTSPTGAILPGINVTLSLSLTKAMSSGPDVLWKPSGYCWNSFGSTENSVYILIRSAGTLTLPNVKRSNISVSVIFKWFQIWI